MYTNVLYIVIVLLLVLALLLFLAGRVLSSRGKTIMKDKMLRDLEEIENLPPPQAEAMENPPPTASDPEGQFIPSTLK